MQLPPTAGYLSCAPTSQKALPRLFWALCRLIVSEFMQNYPTTPTCTTPHTWVQCVSRWVTVSRMSLFVGLCIILLSPTTFFLCLASHKCKDIACLDDGKYLAIHLCWLLLAEVNWTQTQHWSDPYFCQKFSKSELCDDDSKDECIWRCDRTKGADPRVRNVPTKEERLSVALKFIPHNMDEGAPEIYNLE